MKEKTKNKRYSFNAFDVFVLLIIAVLIGTVVYKAYGEISRDSKKDNGVYILEFECSEEYISLSDYVDEDDEVYVKDTGILLGYMRRNIGSTALYVIGGDEAETESETAADNGIQVYDKARLGGALKLNGNAEKSATGEFFMIDGLNITVGATIDVYTDDAEFTIIVKKISNR